MDKMRRIKVGDILKPGAKLEVKKIDFNNPKIKALFEETTRKQHKLIRMQQWTQEDYDAMRRVITI